MQEQAIHWETPGTSRIPFALYTNQDSHKKELERYHRLPIERKAEA